MGTKWRGSTGSLGPGYLILIKSANLDAQQWSAENVAAVISSCMWISMLVWHWHMLVNVGCELCCLDVVSYGISWVHREEYFKLFSPMLRKSFFSLMGKSESLSARDVKINFLFIYLIMLFCSFSRHNFCIVSLSQEERHGDNLIRLI